MDFLLFKIGDIPSGGTSIEIPGRREFPEWQGTVSRLEIHTVIDGTDWQDDLLDVIQEMDLAFPHGFEGTVSLERVGDTLVVSGHILSVARRACSRCTEPFEKKLDISFRTVFTHEVVTGRDIELKKEDLNFSIFHGDMFDIGQVIIDQVSLNLPIKPLCHDDCLGLCVRCGKNLNNGICSCRNESVDIRFEKLKNIHIK